MFKNLVILPVIALIIALAGCETTNNNAAIDAAIAELNFDKRKVSLSIKLLEELQNKEAVDKFSSPLSGKNLPFSSLSEKLDDKKKKETE